MSNAAQRIREIVRGFRSEGWVLSAARVALDGNPVMWSVLFSRQAAGVRITDLVAREEWLRTCKDDPVVEEVFALKPEASGRD